MASWALGKDAVGTGCAERGHRTIGPRVGMKVYLGGDDRPASAMGERGRHHWGARFGAATYLFISRPIIVA